MLFRKKRMIAVAAAVSLVAPLLTLGTAGASSGAAVTSFPRNETLYTSGTAYSPPTIWNPLDLGNFATGTVGLIYEPLFLYNPVNNKTIPWLATSGTWLSSSSYELKLRTGVTWSDGQPFSAADVAYTINLAKTNPNVPYANLGQFIKGVQQVGPSEVIVNFSSPAYTQWENFLYGNNATPILPEHVWSKIPAGQVATFANSQPVGTGPMTLDTANSQEVAYQVNPNWWATKDLGLKLPFKYLVDIVNGSNNVVLGQVLQGNIDLSNNFLPGISKLVGGISSSYGLETYYPKAPYMLSANTVWLEPNLTKAPMSNLNFRKAMAYAIDPEQIASVVYSDIVQPANPTGLLPNLASDINPGVVKQYGFSYNVAKAKAFLKASGYKGQAITIEVPDGWTDWMAGIQVITQDLKAVGINAKTIFPQYATRTSDLTDGTYDLALDNNAGPSANPWAYYDRIFQLPIQAKQTAQLNWERVDDPAAWALVQKLGTIPPTQTSQLKSVYGQLEKITLQTLPEIPLWYNGAWAQYNTTYWTNWPSASSTSDHYTPVTWNGWLGQDTTILGLANLKPVTTPAAS
jgi:peptide/nickel transport system substrate-binding protein